MSNNVAVVTVRRGHQVVACAPVNETQVRESLRIAGTENIDDVIDGFNRGESFKANVSDCELSYSFQPLFQED